MGTERLKRAINDLHLPEVDWVGVREVRETTTSRNVRDGKPQANEVQVSHGAMVEVLAKGQFAYVATPRLDEESLRMAAEQARIQAISASAYSVYKFSSEYRPMIRKSYASPVKRSFPTRTAGEINDLLMRISEKLKISPRIIRVEASARTVEVESHFVSSNGSEASQSYSLLTTDFDATAQEGNIIQKRTDGGFRGRSYQGGWELFESPDLWDRVARVANQAVELVLAEECPTETTSLVIMPDQMMLQIHESIGHPLELDRILGDERNYAGWSFVKPEDFGTLAYGSPLLNAVFDPTVSHEFASYAFDDNGVEAKREFLIKDGVLLRGLGGIESQGRSKLPGVANARASSWNRPPIDRMANLNLEPGTSSWTDIISSVQRGVLMETNRSWSIDDYRNKFQFGCEYARLIENGKITRTVRNPNYRGVTLPFWRSLKKVGDGATYGVFGTPYCGKGEPNQLIRVGHASPVCLFEGVEVFGGA
jgi:predicted Zn-dependent protease